MTGTSTFTTTSASSTKQEWLRSRCATPPKTQYSCTRGFFMLSAQSGAVHAACAGGYSLPRTLAVTYVANDAAKPAKRRKKRVLTVNPERKSTSRLTNESICFGTTASRSWKRTMPHRNRSKGRKPLSGSSEKKPWNVKSRFRMGIYLRCNL